MDVHEKRADASLASATPRVLPRSATPLGARRPIHLRAVHDASSGPPLPRTRHPWDTILDAPHYCGALVIHLPNFAGPSANLCRRLTLHKLGFRYDIRFSESRRSPLLSGRFYSSPWRRGTARVYLCRPPLPLAGSGDFSLTTGHLSGRNQLRRRGFLHFHLRADIFLYRTKHRLPARRPTPSRKRIRIPHNPPVWMRTEINTSFDVGVFSVFLPFDSLRNARLYMIAGCICDVSPAGGYDLV